MIAYLLKSATCLALLLAFYHLVLEKEKMHNFNRFYLLGSVLFSFLAPLYIIYIDATPIFIEAVNTSQEFISDVSLSTENVEVTSFDYSSLLIGLYILISLILLFRFGKNLFNIILKTKKNIKIKYQNAVLILVDDEILPHTFWNYIFINKNDYENKKIEKELFTHELTHVTQKHTLDVLLLELLQAIFWINPFFILLKKAVQLNHEFLADETVIIQHKNTHQYQHLLLNKAAWKNDYYLASNLNYSLTKKRLKMMTTQSSQLKILLKKLAVIPLLAGFVFLFAKRVEAQEIIYEQSKEFQNNKLKKSANSIKDIPLETINEKLHNANGDKIKTGFINISNRTHYFVTVNDETKFYNREGKLANYKGEVISDTKANGSDIIPNHYLTKTYYKGKIFCEFIDNNSELIKEKLQDVNNLLEKNSLSKFLKKYKKLNTLYESKRNQKPNFIKSSKERQSELKESFSLLRTLYLKLSKEDKKKVKKPIHLHHPYVKLMKNNKVFYKLKKDLTEDDELLIPPPSIPKNASNNEKIKYKKAYNLWKTRTGNTISLPPPPPRNHLDQVIKMAKKGAKFFYEEKPINSDKAIDLLKKNRYLTINSKTTNSSNHEVWISKNKLSNKKEKFINNKKVIDLVPSGNT